MSKAANMLRMLMLLRARDKMKIEQLSDKLEVKPRQVRKYKDELEQVGVHIGSERGRYGGYFIERDNNILNLGIDEQEYSILKNAETILKQNNFMFSDEYQLVLDKINSNLKQQETSKNISELVLQSSPNINQKEEKDKYEMMQEAIVSEQKLEMDYFSLSSGLNKRILRPYAIYIYQGFWYVMGHCELRDEIRQFKLTRIKEFKILDESFEKPKDFSLSNYLENTVGIIYDQEQFNVKLEIDFPMSIKVSERVWVDNQKISFREDNSIIFEAEMTGLDDLVNWVLSMGSAVKVIEPEKLKERVNEEAAKILEKN